MGNFNKESWNKIDENQNIEIRHQRNSIKLMLVQRFSTCTHLQEKVKNVKYLTIFVLAKTDLFTTGSNF